MTTVWQLARGASAFTEAEPSPFNILRERSLGAATTGVPVTAPWDQAVEAIWVIRSLKDDWDGEGSEAPHPLIVDGAITFAKALETAGIVPPDRIVAGVNGTVYFEWHTPIGYTELEIVSPTEAEYRSVQHDTDSVTVVKIRRP